MKVMERNRISGVEEILSNASLMVSSKDKGIRKAARQEITEGLSKMTALEKDEAITLILNKLSESADTCQQHYLISILVDQSNPDLGRRIVEAIEKGNGNIEPYTKTYVYGIIKS